MNPLVMSRPMMRLFTALFAAIAVSLFSAISTTVAAATESKSSAAHDLLTSSIKSATHESSVRVTVHFFSGKTTGTVIQDSTRTTGVQVVAIGREQVSIVLVADTAYFSGNSEGLTSYFGVPQSAAPGLAGRWISVQHSDPSFNSVVAGLTLSSALKEVTPTGAIKEGKLSKVGGKEARSIFSTNTSNGSRTALFVATSGRHLPIECAMYGKNGTNQTGEIASFSRWGKRVRALKPSSSIPIALLNTNGSPSTSP
jgi:hypothetical protein